MTFENVCSVTEEDKATQRVMTSIQSDKWYRDPDITPFERFGDKYSIHDGVNLHDHRFVVPFSLQVQVVSDAHHTHEGIVKTKQLIREKIWFASIDKMVEQAVKSCIPCQASLPGPSRREPIQLTPFPIGLWFQVAIDFSGPFLSGYCCKLAVLDEYC